MEKTQFSHLSFGPLETTWILDKYMPNWKEKLPEARKALIRQYIERRMEILRRRCTEKPK